MAWDEWEQLKSEAVQRHTTQVQINSLQGEGGYTKTSDGGGGGGTGTLKHKGGPWTKAASTADELQSTTITSMVGLRSAHDGIGGGLEGLVSLGALKTVLTSWDKRLGAVRDECIDMEPKLRQVAKDMGEVDATVGAKSNSVQVPGTRMGE